MFGKTFASVELKLALQKGYKITKIHSAIEYEKYTGLMKICRIFYKLKLIIINITQRKNVESLMNHIKRWF